MFILHTAAVACVCVRLVLPYLWGLISQWLTFCIGTKMPPKIKRKTKKGEKESVRALGYVLYEEDDCNYSYFIHYYFFSLGVG